MCASSGRIARRRQAAPSDRSTLHECWKRSDASPKNRPLEELLPPPEAPLFQPSLLCYSSFSAFSAGSFFVRCGSVTAKIDATMSTHPTPCMIVSVSPNMR